MPRLLWFQWGNKKHSWTWREGKWQKFFAAKKSLETLEGWKRIPTSYSTLGFYPLVNQNGNGAPPCSIGSTYSNGQVVCIIRWIWRETILFVGPSIPNKTHSLYLLVPAQSNLELVTLGFHAKAMFQLHQSIVPSNKAFIKSCHILVKRMEVTYPRDPWLWLWWWRWHSVVVALGGGYVTAGNCYRGYRCVVIVFSILLQWLRQHRPQLVCFNPGLAPRIQPWHQVFLVWEIRTPPRKSYLGNKEERNNKNNNKRFEPQPWILSIARNLWRVRFLCPR